MNTRIFALTGNIGSGKSTVASLLSKLPGITVHFSDSIAKSIIADPRWRPAFETLLGIGPFAGPIDYRAIATTIFSDEAKRKAFEAFLHPLTWEKIQETIRLVAVSETRTPIHIVESAIIYEIGWENRFDGMIVATCSDRERMRRLTEKRGLSEAEVRSRLKAQLPEAKKAKRADFTIDTECSLKELSCRAETLKTQLLNWKGKP